MLTALVRTNSALTSNSFVSHETITGSRLAITDALVRAFSPRVKVIRVDHTAYPGVISGTGSKGTVSTNPIGFTIKSSVTLAVTVHLTSTMPRAFIFTNSSLTMSATIPRYLAPLLSLECW